MSTINQYESKECHKGNRIEEYLKSIFETVSFDEESVTALRKLTYRNGKFPPYESEELQKWFLLRYLYAEAAAYRNAYKKIVSNMRRKDSINVLSIGCGSGVDYWALRTTLSDLNIKDTTINYTGIDRVEWKFQFNKRKEDSVKIEKGNIGDYLKSSDRCNRADDFDIYMFPLSISEINGPEIEDICRYFENHLASGRDKYVVFTARTDSNATNGSYVLYPGDENKMDQLYSRAKSIHQRKIGDLHEIWACKNEYERMYINIKYKDMIYPEEIRDYFKMIPAMCRRHHEENRKPCGNNCKECSLNRLPIEYNNYYCSKYFRINGGM